MKRQEEEADLESEKPVQVLLTVSISKKILSTRLIRQCRLAKKQYLEEQVEVRRK